MICFLTSNPFLPDDSALNPANGFVDALLESLPKRPLRGLFVASSPDEPDTNDFYAALQRAAFETSGVAFGRFDILDRRTAAGIGLYGNGKRQRRKARIVRKP